MLAPVGKTHDLLIVDRDDTPFMGVSGRQVASLKRGTEIIVIGERGPYTIVCWDSRNGYVPSDSLVSPDAFSTEFEAPYEATSVQVSKPRLNLLRFLFSRQRSVA